MLNRLGWGPSYPVSDPHLCSQTDLVVSYAQVQEARQ